MRVWLLDCLSREQLLLRFLLLWLLVTSSTCLSTGSVTATTINPLSPDDAPISATTAAIQIYRSATCLGLREAAMANPVGESESGVLRLDFDRRLTLQFRGSAVTSDAGLLAYRELDDALGLTALAGEMVADARTGKNGRHALLGLLRQSVFGRSAGYEDVNDAERLRHDPAMRWIVGGKAAQGCAASPSQMAASRRNGSRHPRTSLQLPICPAGGSTLCTVAARREALCSTWIRA